MPAAWQLSRSGSRTTSAGGPAITTPAQTFTITVNRPPVAMEQMFTTTRNTPRAVTLNAWDMDGDALTYTVASGPAHGSLLGIAPNLTYTPAMGYTGPDSFSFTANDGQATSAPATVTITVNAPPVANAGADQTGNIGQVLTFSPPPRMTPTARSSPTTSGTGVTAPRAASAP